MESFSFRFEETDCVHNVVSKAVLPKCIANDVLNHSTISENLYKAFIGDRINGATSIWAPMKKCCLGSFKIQVKSIRSKVGEKMVQLKEEKNLMSRFLITARKRPELDLEHCIGNYKFSVVPRALFSSDGLPLPCIDKSKLMHHSEEMAGVSDDVTSVQENSVIIIDGMAVVNQICKDATLKTCKVSAFLKSIVIEITCIVQINTCKNHILFLGLFRQIRWPNPITVPGLWRDEGWFWPKTEHFCE